jgi:MarR family transcriptional regulator, organic hydroperoxide resistance regulator
MNDVPRLGDQLCFLLHATSRAFDAAYRPVLAKLGLTYPQSLVMLVLWEQDGQTVSEIGQRLFLDSGTLTPLLKRLEAQGVVIRKRDLVDERLVRVNLTKTGSHLRRAARSVPAALSCRLSLDPHTVQALRSGMDEIMHALAD